MKYLDENELIEIIKMYFNDSIAASAKITESCLLINGINVRTKEPLRWFMEDGATPIMSSVTRQIHLLKAFKLFSTVTGESDFAERYYDILKFYFSNYQNPNGLINWGGHVFIDLETMKPTGPINKKMRHELKNTFPDYETMYQVNPEATLKFIKSFWGSHISDKDSLVISRHGFINDDIDFDFSTYHPSKMNSIISSSLTFLNSANDLVYAALKYYKYTKDISAVRVSEQLLNKYVELRDKNTGLGVYQYTIAERSRSGEDDNETRALFGDRAARQLGPELGEKALEMNMITQQYAYTIYAENPIMLFNLYRELGDVVKPMCQQAVAALEAFSKYIYKKETNKCRNLLIDGTDITGFVLQRNGYYGEKGHKFQEYSINGRMFFAQMIGAILFDNKILFETAKSMFRHFDLGELGESAQSKFSPNYLTNCSDPYIAIALVDIYQLTKNEEYMILAECVIDKMIRTHWYYPYFKPFLANRYASIDSREIYAASYFLSVSKGKIPEPYFSSYSFIYGNHLFPSGVVKDNRDILTLFNTI